MYENVSGYGTCERECVAENGENGEHGECTYAPGTSVMWPRVLEACNNCTKKGLWVQLNFFFLCFLWRCNFFHDWRYILI